MIISGAMGVMGDDPCGHFGYGKFPPKSLLSVKSIKAYFAKEGGPMGKTRGKNPRMHGKVALFRRNRWRRSIRNEKLTDDHTKKEDGDARGSRKRKASSKERLPTVVQKRRRVQGRKENTA